MIDYIIESNPDDRIIQKASNILQRGGIVAFPTETNWVAAANPFHKDGIDKLYRLRQVENNKHLSVMVSDFRMAMEIAHIDDHAFALLRKVIPGPYTFIFEAQKSISKFLKASKTDHEVGIRFPPGKLPRTLIEKHGGPVLTTHINHKTLELDDDSFPLYSAQIEDFFGNKIDLILDPGEFEFVGSTTIVDFTSGEPEVIRQGIGDSSLFKRG